MNVTCCPMYTIRCKALEFKLRKSHKKVLKKVNRYLIDGIKPAGDKDHEECAEDDNKGGKTEKQTVNESEEKPGTSTSESEPTSKSAEKRGASSSSRTPRPGFILYFFLFYLNGALLT